MNLENLERFNAWLQAEKLEAALLSNPATLTWLTGYAPPIQTGPSPFEGGPALAWARAGELTVIASDAEAGAVAGAGAPVQDYVSYTIAEPLRGAQNQAAALRRLLEGSPADRVGVEYNTLPASFLPGLHQALPEASFRPVDGAFDRLRAVKTAGEVSRIRAALRLCDLAQGFVRDSLQPGLAEIELWGLLKARLELEAGGRLPVLADLVGGLRTAEVGGLPGAYRLQAGDPVIADIVPRLDGYWGDNAGTHFLGHPQPELKKIYAIVRDALRRGVDAVRPGVLACDLDAMLREQVQAAGYAPYPHHSGHGLGASFHEEPRLVPDNDLPLETGMVVAIEPGIYVPGLGGVRLEDVVLVQPGGCELLTTHLVDEV
ncbi:MAG TPA: Xaa-Pro peptidase family protein [Anaerolineales bacterium]